MLSINLKSYLFYQNLFDLYLLYHADIERLLFKQSQKSKLYIGHFLKLVLKFLN